MQILSFVSFITGMISAYIVTPFFYQLLKEGNCIRLNYRGDKIPIGMGLIFLFIQCILVFSISLFFQGKSVEILTYLLSLILIGLAGLIDDLIGTHGIKGIRGHIGALLKKKLTTGGLKAIIGLIGAFIFAITVSNTVMNLILNTVLIMLFTNLINLFDLRPGRSSKVFIIISIILLITSSFHDYNYILYSLLGIMIIYLPFDIKGRVMMGDTGSNALGITLGVFCVVSQLLYVKVIYLSFLIFLHILAEVVSFTNIINKSRLLKYIDHMGQ